MHSLRLVFLRAIRAPKAQKSINLNLCERTLLPFSWRGLSSKESDGYRTYSRRDHYDEDDDTDDVSFSERRPVRSGHERRSFTSSHNSYSQSSRNFPRRHSNEFDDYDEEAPDRGSYREQGFRNSRFDSKELGANIKKKVWDASQLPSLEKNFYIEHPSVAQMSQGDVDAFYKSHNIAVKRGQRPNPVTHFDQANFPEEVSQQLIKNGWKQPTPIQSLGWPLALSGKNMVAIAQTGSGKTLGFILPALVHIKHQKRVAKGEGPVVLVLAPTRELAQQIKSVAVEYGRLLGVQSCCLFGGQSKLVQARHLSQGPEIVVATPGRLLDFLEMNAINLDRTSYVVLDEADRMLDMGFEPQIRKVLEQIRPDRQMLMWSATWPKEIQQLAHDFLGEFVQVNIGSVELMANPNIQQIVHVCEREDKLNMLVKELEKAGKEGHQKTLIFAQTKSQADFITHRLRKLRFKALAIHGDKSQLVRDQTLNSFKNGESEILVATDVASRGLDVNDIKLVVNFDYPNSADDYIHRIGRTARAEKTGTAVTFVTSEDAGKVDDLIKVLKDAGQEVPVDLHELNNFSAKFNARGSSKSKFGQNRKPYNSGYSRRNSW